MTEVTILKNDTFWLEPIGQGETIRHLAQAGEFHSMPADEAERLCLAGLATPGRGADVAPAEPAAVAEEAPPAEPEAPAPAAKRRAATSPSAD